MTNKSLLRVGFVGLGTMGAAMAANVLRAGFSLTAWNRSPGRGDALAAAGASLAPTPAAVAAASDVVVVCVSDTRDVEAVLFGEDGVAAGAAAGTLVIDCSTIDPGETRAFAARLAGRGIRFVDAPVTGGSEGAVKGTLAILVGGEAADVERARPILEAMGTSITHFGPAGAGQAAKAVNQVILAGTYLGVAEGMVLAIKAGLDPEQVVTALSAGAAQSWVLANRSGRMLANDYPLGFKVALHLKDLGIALALAREAGAALPVSALAAQLEAGLIANGHGDDDMSALARAIRSLSGLDS
jgi:3-hydroxyisobutyrate dehydrogenase